MIHEIYLKELSKALGYLPAWFPNSKLELGDFLDRNTLERKGNIGSLRDEAICFTVRPASARGSFEYSSARGVSITTKIAGQVVVGSSLGKVDAGLIVKFSKENVIVFEASGCTSIAIDDINSLGSAIMALYNAGHWSPDWVVVTELVRARCATIIISGDKSAQIDLKANGKLTPAGYSLADPNARFAAKNVRDVVFKFIAENGLTPLYRASGIKRNLLMGPRFSPADRSVSSRARRRSSSEEFLEFLGDDFFVKSDERPLMI